MRGPELPVNTVPFRLTRPVLIHVPGIHPSGKICPSAFLVMRLIESKRKFRLKAAVDLRGLFTGR